MYCAYDTPRWGQVRLGIGVQNAKLEHKSGITIESDDFAELLLSSGLVSLLNLMVAWAARAKTGSFIDEILVSQSMVPVGGCGRSWHEPETSPSWTWTQRRSIPTSRAEQWEIRSVTLDVFHDRIADEAANELYR